MSAAKRLNRQTFQTSRLLDFCSRKELVAQAGHGEDDWPLVALKELLDNALDACEEAGVPPAVAVRVDGQGITVTDNGPGIPPETVAGVLDFAVRVSSREAYVSPTRGAQGNALKVLVAMPFVLDGDQGRVTIAARGVRHEVSLRVDTIRQKPVIDHRQEPDRLVRTGSAVTVHWPDSASSILTAAKWGFLQIASDYPFLNPHLALTVDWFGEETRTSATDAGWRKWLPGDPTCAHWYTPERFGRLVAAYLAHDTDNGGERTVRAFVAEFGGLTGTAKQKQVLDQTGLARASLSALRNGEGLDHGRTAGLLEAMKQHTRPVRPAALGAIGKEHLAKRLEGLGCEMGTFQYRRSAGETDGLPWVIETAFAWCPEASSRRLVTGVNWSPGILNPFRQLGRFGQSLDAVLERQRAGQTEPVVLVLHLTCPLVEYTDRGKSAVVIGGGSEDDGDPDDVDSATEKGSPVDAQAIINLVNGVTGKWCRQRKAEERQASRALRRREALVRADRVTIKDAAYAVIERAYLKASNNGQYPAHARQVMYAARPLIQEMTGRQLDDQYFCQTLLPDYLNDHPQEAAGWDVVFDARGHFEEPHTGLIVPLGTLDVRRYLAVPGDVVAASPIKATASALLPTHGPAHRFGAILFVEKEGFLPLFKAAHLAERYDIAIMSTKGLSVTAARLLVDRLCGEHGIPLFVLHDFDKSGFSIVGTLQRDTRRYSFRNAVLVIDLGLRLADVEEWELEGEDVVYGKSDPAPNLRENGATEEEIDFLRDRERCGWNHYVGRRVELNAFSSADLVAWIEAGLERHGVKKVVPDVATLEAAFRRATAAALAERRLGEIVRQAEEEAERARLPRTLARQVKARLREEPALAWDSVVNQLARSFVRNDAPREGESAS